MSFPGRNYKRDAFEHYQSNAARKRPHETTGTTEDDRVFGKYSTKRFRISDLPSDDDVYPALQNTPIDGGNQTGSLELEDIEHQTQGLPQFVRNSHSARLRQPHIQDRTYAMYETIAKAARNSKGQQQQSTKAIRRKDAPFGMTLPTQQVDRIEEDLLALGRREAAEAAYESEPDEVEDQASRDRQHPAERDELFDEVIRRLIQAELTDSAPVLDRSAGGTASLLNTVISQPARSLNPTVEDEVEEAPTGGDIRGGLADAGRGAITGTAARDSEAEARCSEEQITVDATTTAPTSKGLNPSGSANTSQSTQPEGSAPTTSTNKSTSPSYIFLSNGTRKVPLDPEDLRKFGLVEGECCKTNCFDENGVENIGKDCLSRLVIFVWKNKHGISDNALIDLFDIVGFDWFDRTHLPRSPTTIKGMREQLPLPIILTEKVEVDTNKSDSETPPEVQQYTFDIKELLERSLNNPQIYEQCHFGAAVSSNTRREAHDGELWKGSITTSLDIYPQKIDERQDTVQPDDGPPLQSHVYPGGCFLVDACDNNNNLREVLTRVIGLYRKRKNSDNLLATVQPILRTVEDLQLFGLSRFIGTDVFDFSPTERRVLVSEIESGKVTASLSMTQPIPEGKGEGDYQVVMMKNCYILKASYQMDASRLKSAICLEIDRSSDNVDDVLPRLKILRRGDRLPTKADFEKGNVEEDWSVKPKRKGKGKATMTVRGRGNASKLDRSKSRPSTRKHNESNRSGQEPETTGSTHIDTEEATISDDEEGYARLTPKEREAIVSDSLTEANTVNGGVPSHIVCELIIPEVKDTIFDRNLFKRGLPVPTAIATELHQGKKHNSKARAAKKLKTLSDTELKAHMSRLGYYTSSLASVRPMPYIAMERLISAGHCRKTSAELEIEKGEIDLDALGASEIPVKGIVIDLYSDKFGVFRTAHRTTGGVYMTLLNLDYRGRDQCQNHTLCGFIPHGAKFSETGQSLMVQLAALAKGVKMFVNGVETLESFICPSTLHSRIPTNDQQVFVKLLSFNGDMEEANAIAGINTATSRTGCRFCYLPSCSYDDTQFFRKEWEKQVLKRQMHICERLRKRAFEDVNSKGNVNANLMLEAGLLPSVPIISTHGPAFDRSIQVYPSSDSQDSATTLCRRGSDAGNGVTLTPTTHRWQSIFRTSSKKDWEKWQYTESSINSSIPFILKEIHMHTDSDDQEIFETGVLATFRRLYPDQESTHKSLLAYVIEVYAAVAKANKKVFARTMVKDDDCLKQDDYRDMETALLDTRRMLDELYQPLDKNTAMLKMSKTGKQYMQDPRGGVLRKLPNFHQAAHMPDTARLFGTNLVTSCSIGELVHKLWKQMVPHTNYYELDREFCKFWATMDSLRFLIDAEVDHGWTPKLLFLRRQMPSLFCGYFFGQIARQSDEGEWVTNKTGLASRIELMKMPRFPDIFFGAPVPFKVAKDEIKYPTVLLGRKPTDPAIEGLTQAYASYSISQHDLDLTSSEVIYNKDGITSTRKLARLQWWESIAYYDTFSETRSRIRIGDFITVDITEQKKMRICETEEDLANTYARVLGKSTSPPPHTRTPSQPHDTHRRHNYQIMQAITDE
ncbi:hypothetical protein BJ508DRAFT_335411 [Ascobolus immersus RN42]|uniref:Uncharacterized protein n=1 Tax=Ascobolus immersus RN42 TaxID=1160509 RepID=A0A3N4HCH1_ASCIM|nr:hypothetical protein BJ508DRAFT_335411 [Ascobolus immersus RN42]